MKVYLELVEGKSAKFWEISVKGSAHTVRFGRLGADGQSKTKRLSSPAAAMASAQTLVQTKRKKGYTEPSTKGSATTKTAAKASARASKQGGGFVASGQFQAALEASFGPLKKVRKPRRPPVGFGEHLSRLPTRLAREVEALFAIQASYQLPALCGLEWGRFVTKPSEYGLETADAIEAEEWFFDEEDIDVVLRSLEVFHDGEFPSILVGERGVYAFEEDPHGLRQVADGLEPFLRVVTSLEASAQGKADPRTAEDLLYKEIYATDDAYEKFFSRTLAQALEHPPEPSAPGPGVIVDRLARLQESLGRSSSSTALEPTLPRGPRDVTSIAPWRKGVVALTLGGGLYVGPRKVSQHPHVCQIAAANSTAWLAAADGLSKSADLEHWETVLGSGTDKQYTRVAVDGDGGVYTVKTSVKRSSELLYSADGRTFELLATSRPDEHVVMLVQGVTGDVLVGSRHGRLSVARDGSLEDTSLRLKGWAWAGCITARGTILVSQRDVGYRSVDGGRTFDRTKINLGQSFPRTLCALPDGRVVAAGDGGRVAVSDNDGRTFDEKIGIPGSSREVYHYFDASCLASNALFLGGFEQPLVKFPIGRKR